RADNLQRHLGGRVAQYEEARGLAGATGQLRDLALDPHAAEPTHPVGDRPRDRTDRKRLLGRGLQRHPASLGMRAGSWAAKRGSVDRRGTPPLAPTPLGRCGCRGGSAPALGARVPSPTRAAWRAPGATAIAIVPGASPR